MAKQKLVEREGRDKALLALGQQIRTVRQARGISQEDFAAHAGIARSYYGGIERGENNVAALNLMRIALALGVEVGDLFPRSETLREFLLSPPKS
ncbi:hypothetical protein IAD21_06434 (plasmid) [Abditibacteriota bacterium]|nr:hypothetical protein IAD21_06434 [Abditibacteriota bacterium]